MGTYAIAPENNKCPKCGKRIFETRQEADDFEEKNRAQNGHQYSYLCEYSDKFHLTAQKPGDHGTTTNYEKIENAAPQRRKYARYRTLTSEEIAQALDLKSKGMSFAALARKFGTGYGPLYKALKDARRIPPPVTVDSLESQEREVEMKLNRIREEKQKLIEAARIKVLRLADGRIQLKKELQSFILPEEDCITLVTMLEDFLTAQAA